MSRTNMVKGKKIRTFAIINLLSGVYKFMSL